MPRPTSKGQATSSTRPPIAPPPSVQVPPQVQTPRPIQQGHAPSRTQPPTVPAPDVQAPSQAQMPHSDSTQQGQATSRTRSPTITPPDVPSQAQKRRRAARTKKYMRDDENEKYYQLGKMIPRLVHPFLPTHQLIYFGSLLYMQQNAEEDEDFELGSKLQSLDPSDMETIQNSFAILIDHAPWMKDVIPAAIEDRELLKKIESLVGEGSSQAHSDDTSALKLSCIPWIQEDLSRPLEPPLQTDSKAGRGFHHPVLAKMLCPGSKQRKFANDRTYLNELKLGNVSDEDFPAFCYESSFCDPKNIELGLFKGIFLQRTFRRIFTGPGSVLNEKPGPPTKRKTNADIIGLEQVTPRSIAYAVVQARLVLSDKGSWNQCDGEFSYRHFYETIVSVFEDNPELPWVEETLKWWDDHVLAPSSHAKAIQARKCSGSPTMAQRLNAQRKKSGSEHQSEEPDGPEEPEDTGEPEEPESVTEPESD